MCTAFCTAAFTGSTSSRRYFFVAVCFVIEAGFQQKYQILSAITITKCPWLPFIDFLVLKVSDVFGRGNKISISQNLIVCLISTKYKISEFIFIVICLLGKQKNENMVKSDWCDMTDYRTNANVSTDAFNVKCLLHQNWIRRLGSISTLKVAFSQDQITFRGLGLDLFCIPRPTKSWVVIK